MPTLDWIGKKAVLNHHKEVPYHLLKCDKKLSVGDPGSSNLLVQGDNLLALKALLPYYAGKVKCIYIDPPYNTGNENWIYNDAVNSPEMREWLGKVVGGESEDLSRHDKWLSMMYPRLVLLREFLTEDGAIFISIDDNEIAPLRLLMNEIFGAKNFVATIIWNMMDSPKNSARHLSEDHEYLVLYAADKNKWKPNPLPRTEAMNARYKNPDEDPRGPWLLSDLAARNFYAQGRYSITTPSGKVIDGPPSGSYWRVSESKFWDLDKDNRIWWGKNKSNRPGIKRFLTDVKDGVVPRTIWPWQEVGSTRHSKQEISQILDLGASSDLFVTPKPTKLIGRILQIATDKDSLILDSFSGSGTTGHAVLKQNEEDGGSRRFLLVEMEESICREFSHKRLSRVIQGHKKKTGSQKIEIPALGGGFRFCNLGSSLFDETGQIQEEIKFGDLAAHVYFSETGEPIPKRSTGKTPLLGTHNDTAIYLLYNGILEDKSPGGGNALTRSVLEKLPRNDGPKVIFGTSCRLGRGLLKREKITFRQIPYELKVG